MCAIYNNIVKMPIREGLSRLIQHDKRLKILYDIIFSYYSFFYNLKIMNLPQLGTYSEFQQILYIKRVSELIL